MKNVFKFVGITALAVVIGFSIIACDNGGGGGGGRGPGGPTTGTDPTSATYTHTDGGENTYTLVVTKVAGRAVYTPVEGDSYVLTIKDPDGLLLGTSKGTVVSFTNGILALKHEGGTEFTATIEGTRITAFSSDIPIENGVTIPKPTPGGETHEHQWGEWVVTKEPTETENGEETRTCALDSSHKETRTISATGEPGHTHQWGNWIVTRAVTCTETGEETRTCSDPSHQETRPIEALGHDWGNWTQTNAPTCETAGVDTRTCAHDATHKEIRAGAAALGHDWGNWTATTPATCETAGVETRTCSHDATHKETRSVAALGHNWSNWTATTPATCETAGVETRTCSRDATHKETRAGAAALGHDWNTGYTTITAATESTDGIEAITCKHNASHTKEQRTLYAIGTQGLVFELINNGSAYCLRYATNFTYDVVYIPAMYRLDAESAYLPVEEIGNGVDGHILGFNFTTLHIPASVKKIQRGVFLGGSQGSKLTTVTFANGSQLEYIGIEAFRDCTSLTNITLPESVTYIGAAAFQNCTSLTSITIPAGVTSVSYPFGFWTASQTINVQGKANRAATIAAGWSSNWDDGCNARIYYQP
jgi:hypothetical protein